MKNFIKVFIFTFIMLIFISNYSFAAKNDIKVSINPENIYNGTSFSINIISSKKISTIFGSFLGKQLYFCNLDKEGKNYKVWAGVPIETEIGTKNVYLNIYFGKKHIRLVEKINILTKKFPIQKIDLPAGQVSLLTSKALERESQIIGGCFKSRTLIKYFNGKFIIPTKGEITSQFGLKRIYLNSSASWPHKGIDIGGYGGEKILATNSGKIILSSTLKAHGNTIIIDHGFGVLSIYCHMKKRYVNKGDLVKKGAIIGLLGKTGIATGEHLHFGLSINDVRVDPIQFIESDITL